jgi:hypothetical protein
MSPTVDPYPPKTLHHVRPANTDYAMLCMQQGHLLSQFAVSALTIGLSLR